MTETHDVQSIAPEDWTNTPWEKRRAAIAAGPDHLFHIESSETGCQIIRTYSPQVPFLVICYVTANSKSYAEASKHIAASEVKAFDLHYALAVGLDAAIAWFQVFRGRSGHLKPRIDQILSTMREVKADALKKSEKPGKDLFARPLTGQLTLPLFSDQPKHPQP
jgi:hypothetical protein